MVIMHEVEGYENFCEYMRKFEDKKEDVFIYFGGSKDENGISWCDDCIRAYPVIEKALEQCPKDAHFVVCYVGDRPTFKDPECKFRKDPRTQLRVIPALLKWLTVQRLDGDQCENADLVEFLFTYNEDDDF